MRQPLVAQLTFDSCGAAVPAEDMNLSTLTAKCRRCDSVFGLGGTSSGLKLLGESSTAVPVAFWRAQHMTHKWPFRDHEQYLDRPLNEIRAEYGIEVVTDD